MSTKFKSHRVTQAGGQYDQITENEDTLRPGVDERWHTEAIDLCSYDRQVFHPVLAIAWRNLIRFIRSNRDKTLFIFKFSVLKTLLSEISNCLQHLRVFIVLTQNQFARRKIISHLSNSDQRIRGRVLSPCSESIPSIDVSRTGMSYCPCLASKPQQGEIHDQKRYWIVHE